MESSLSQSEQDYLKTIFALTQFTNLASTNDIAARLNVRPASVTSMVKKLAEASPALVDYQKRQGAKLTSAGRKAALEMIRHHRLLETFLHEKLGYSWDEVHEEAERLEHAISEEMEERMALALGDPTCDPHGAPIPTRELEMPASYSKTSTPLSTLQINQNATIQRVPDRDPALLRFFSEHGLVPAAQLTILDIRAFDQNIQLQIQGQATPLTLGRQVSDEIFVEIH
jgi:DtxR family Mn-dependent transcriptional regulator